MEKRGNMSGPDGKWYEGEWVGDKRHGVSHHVMGKWQEVRGRVVARETTRGRGSMMGVKEGQED